MKKTVITIFSGILLMIISYLMHDRFVRFSLLQLKFENINFVSSFNNNKILFVFSFGIIPLFHLLVDKIVKIKSLKRSMIVFGIIFLSGGLLWQIRVYNISVKLKLLSEYFFINNIKGGYDMDGLKFELNLLLGFISGTIITIIFYKCCNKIASSEKSKD